MQKWVVGGGWWCGRLSCGCAKISCSRAGGSRGCSYPSTCRLCGSFQDFSEFASHCVEESNVDEYLPVSVPSSHGQCRVTRTRTTTYSRHVCAILGDSRQGAVLCIATSVQARLLDCCFAATHSRAFCVHWQNHLPALRTSIQHRCQIRGSLAVSVLSLRH